MRISFTLNHQAVGAEVPPGMRLVEMLREVFDLTGTKESCGQGECGACTVILDGDAVHACMLLAAQVNGCTLLTIEGLGPDGGMGEIQKAFLEAGAVQCGYCTPGMVMSTKALLMRTPHPSRGQIEQALAGNICRCTGYKKIIEAVELAAEREGGHA